MNIKNVLMISTAYLIGAMAGGSLAIVTALIFGWLK